MRAEFTPEQRRAISGRGNMLVSAAAGSGKTAVLTERIANLVLAGADITRMLVVTYTKAAAAEMKKRVAGRLRELSLELERPEEAARLQQAAVDSARANISTLHAFCAQVLRRHFQEAGLDPAFSVADEAQTDILRADALAELMEDGYSAGPELVELAQAMGGDEKLFNLVLELFEFMHSQPEPQKWLEEAVARYAATPGEVLGSPAAAELLAAYKRRLSAQLEGYAALRAGCREGLPGVAAVMDGDLLALSAALRQRTLAEYAAVLGVKFGMLRWPKDAPEGLKATVKAAREKLKELVKAQREVLLRPPEEEAELLARMHPHLVLLKGLVGEFCSRYSALKATAGVIDYVDMEHLTLALLQKGEIAAEYRARFEYILVDEYQDANRVQERILAAIRREDNLFMVGDIKQSIYRFRMADPSLFAERMAEYAAGGGTLVHLGSNFRSSGCVLSAANDVFSRIMSREVGEVDYDENAMLRPGRELPGGSAELVLLPRHGAEHMEEAEAEAVVAARRIRSIMQTQQYMDPKTGVCRPYRYGDFAVLHRSVKNVAELWVRTLALEGVPAHAELTGGYFDAIEVQLFLNLLRIIDNRRQDIPLISLLRSPIGGFSTEELVELRRGAEGEECLNSLLRLSGADTLAGRKAASLLARVERWRGESLLLSVEELCGRLLDETGYYEFVAALPGGGRTENLDALVERARAYEKQGGRGLGGFIAYMDRVKDTGKIGAAAAAGADVVRVISIHRSKGLEFPVVILAGLGRGFNREDDKKDILMDRRLGLGVRCVLGGKKCTSMYREAILASQRLAALSEEMRVLYVGMTRAERSLVMLASVDEPDEVLAQAAATSPTPARVAGASGVLGLLLPALMDTPAGNPVRRELGLSEAPGEASVCICVEHPGRSTAERGVQEYSGFARAAAGSEPASLGWRYPFEQDTVVPAKLSVSQLTGNFSSMRQRPAFCQGGLSALDRGSAMHAALQYIPLLPHTESSAAAAIQELVEKGVLSGEYAAAADPAAIAEFFASPLGQRLLASPRVERELEFNHRVKASSLLGVDSAEEVLLQGVIDCCFLEDGAWVILDYKTDYVPPGKAQQVAARHRPQVELYCSALSQLSGLPVAERYIHLISIGKSIMI